MSSKDKLENVSFGSETCDEILDTLRDSYLDSKFESKWHPAKVQIIRNPNLMKQFEEKKQEFFVHGHKPDEMEERFGFLVENNVARLEAIIDLGLHAEDSEYNALGYNCMGIYLCRFVDVCLQHALVKYCGSNIIRLIVFKYLNGRQTTAIPRVASAAEFIEPTQGFDSHISVILPSHSDSLQNQYDRSQVYLYEINKLLQPTPSPRQVLPYAVITFTVDGVYNSSIDVEPTCAEKLANNPQLQLIIKQINSRSGPSAESNPPSSGVTVPSTKTLNAPSVSGVRSAVSGQAVGLPPTVLTLGRAGSLLGSAVKSGDPSELADSVSTSENMKLQKVISELNAKLGAEEVRKSALGDVMARGNTVIPLTSESLFNPDYLTRRPALSTNLPGVMPAVGVLPAAGILNVHPTISSGTSQFPSNAAAVNAGVPAYSLLKPGLANVASSQSAVAGFLGNIPGQPTVVSRPGSSDPAAAMTAMASYISIPNGTASFFPQNAIYPFDYVQTILSPAKDGALSAAGFYPFQAINPAAAGYTVVGQAVKRPMAGEYLPYVEKKPKYF